MNNYTKIKEAYKASKNIYDDTLTQNKWWAKLYINFFWGGVNDIQIANRVLNMISTNFSGSLLDVPVGTAVFTADYYRTIPKAQITCLDYSKDMLLQAKKRLTEKNIYNANCIQEDVGNLPFTDNQFDIVLSMNGFHAFPNKKKAFAETARVLKKAGIFIGCFYIRGESRRTDFIVNTVLSKKGWFTPPFYTLEALQKELEMHYSQVEIKHEKAMVYFRCIK